MQLLDVAIVVILSGIVGLTIWLFVGLLLGRRSRE
jgi:hypothetical protein